METEQAVASDTASSSDKNPIVAAILSLVIPGVGQYYAGDANRALIVFGATAVYYILAVVLSLIAIGLLLVAAAPIVHIIAGVDAFVQCND